MQRESVRSSSYDSAYIAERSFIRWKRFDRTFERAKSAMATMASENCAIKEGTGAKCCVLSVLCDVRKQSSTLETFPISSNVALYREKCHARGRGPTDPQPAKRRVVVVVARESEIKLKTDVVFSAEREGNATVIPSRCARTERGRKDAVLSRQPFASTRDFIPPDHGNPCK